MTTPQTPPVNTSARRTGEQPTAPRSRDRNLGGPRTKLSVLGDIPGYHLYWCNSDGTGELESLLYEGFEYVSPAEIRLTSHVVPDGEVDSRVSRFVGRQEDGSPLRAFLLKCPESVWQEREADRQAVASERETAIRNSGNVKGRYQPKGTSISIDSSLTSGE